MTQLAQLAGALSEMAQALAKTDDDTEREKRLAVILVALMLDYLETENAEQLRVMFLAALRHAYDDLQFGDEFRDLIEAEIENQKDYLDGFIEDVMTGAISEKQTLARAKQYATSLGKVRSQIQLKRAGDTLMRWDYAEESQHCTDCLGLNGQVKPASEWLKLGLYPKSPLLECSQGCNCTQSASASV